MEKKDHADTGPAEPGGERGEAKSARPTGRYPLPQTWLRGSLIIFSFVALGELFYKISRRFGRFFSLDREIVLWGPVSEWEPNIPVFASSAALIFSGYCWLVAARALERRQIAARVFGLLLIYMGFDELLGLHERFESMAGKGWQVLFLPVMAFAGVLWILVLVYLWRRHLRRAAVSLACGASLWVIAQAFERLQWANREKAAEYVPMMIVEELCELAGSCFFGYAATLTIAALTARRLVPQRDS